MSRHRCLQCVGGKLDQELELGIGPGVLTWSAGALAGAGAAGPVAGPGAGVCGNRSRFSLSAAVHLNFTCVANPVLYLLSV